MGETPRNSVALANTVKNYRSASLLACKPSLLRLSSNRKSKGRVARGWLTRAPHLLTPPPHVTKRAKRARSQERESFVLRASLVGGMGVREFHID